MRVLVTGGAGFVGSHVVDLLVAGGHEVVVLDSLVAAAPDRVPAAAQLVAAETTPSASRQWRDMAARKLPELDRHIAQAQALRQAVADCLECGCMNFDRCLLLDATEATA